MRRCGLILVAMLAGCAGKPQRCPVCPSTPVAVDVPLPVRAPLPPELAAPVPDPWAGRAIVTVGDAVQAAKQRKAALARANSRLVRLRELRE
jgi:hypothetical protein